MMNNRNDNKNFYNNGNKKRDDRKGFDKRNKQRHYQNTNFNNSYSKKRSHDDLKVVSTNVNKEQKPPESNKPFDNKLRRFGNQKRGNKKNRKFSFNPFENKNKSNQNQNQKNFKNKQKYQNVIQKNRDEGTRPKQRIQRVPRTIIPYTIKSLKKETCVKCSRIINDMPNSIRNPQKEEYYHFDCIMREIRINNNIKNNQRLVYTGSGNFAIIEDVVENGRKKFVIKKSIPFFAKAEQ